MNWIEQNWVLLTWSISILYCVWRFNKRYAKTSLDGVIGTSPGLDTMLAAFIAPILALTDIVVITVRWIKKKLK